MIARTTQLLATAALLWAPALPAASAAQEGAPDTVRVAAPSGEREADRASILAALERANPGDAVLFARGTYLIGELIHVPTPRLTLLGDDGGTVLRGCEPDVYDALERQLVREDEALGPDAGWRLLSRCGLFQLTGGHVAVRGLTFEYSRLGLILGCCEAENVLGSSAGGYLIEGNTFRNMGNSIRAVLASEDPTVIRGNRFINTFHALSAGASRVHMLDNDISVPEPERVPGTAHPGFAISIRPPPPGAAGSPTGRSRACERNVIAGNRIVGHPDGVLLRALPGTQCSDNMIRGNTIDVRRVPIPNAWVYADLSPLPSPEDSTFVGIPLALTGIHDNLIEGNRIIGADGLGIAMFQASRNRIVGNTIAGIRQRDPFPGNTDAPGSEQWGKANGSGMWLSPGSNENEIVGNLFEDVAGYEVFLEGDGNSVELLGASDAVRDLGSGNTVAMGRAGVDPRALADQVTIYRDAYGVPHVHGETDAAAVFGYMYAQAEDALGEVEREVAEMTG
ncbi:MAG TPA: right-handed parallel beta-helix repeat-containing protein, partial [Longimicrobiaceae bacterium]|nr:right-handed parallel beta-helix repeat-containing protein [Longimicrobiaceae bacterium]